MILIYLIITLSINFVSSIKFNYLATKYEFICFQQQTQKETRYQLIIKSDKPTYSLQIFQQDNSIYEDERLDTFIKYYSAFSKYEGIILFCLANKDINESILYQIQFYHGSHLEGIMAELGSDSFSQLEQVYGQCVEMQGFVDSAYVMNVKTLLERNQIIGGMGFGLVLATIVFFIALAVSRATLLIKLKKVMRTRKLI